MAYEKGETHLTSVSIRTYGVTDYCVLGIQELRYFQGGKTQNRDFVRGWRYQRSLRNWSCRCAVLRSASQCRRNQLQGRRIPSIALTASVN
jgi:hypothetical protein